MTGDYYLVEFPSIYTSSRNEQLALFIFSSIPFWFVGRATLRDVFTYMHVNGFNDVDIFSSDTLFGGFFLYYQGII